MLEKGSGHKKPAVFYTLQHSFATHLSVATFPGNHKIMQLIYGDFHDIQEETGDRL